VSDSTLALRFNDPLESMFQAGGISYFVEGGVMRIVVDRCRISTECTTMLPLHIVPGPAKPGSQEIPLRAPRVVMVFKDGEEEIFPCGFPMKDKTVLGIHSHVDPDREAA